MAVDFVYFPIYAIIQTKCRVVQLLIVTLLTLSIFAKCKPSNQSIYLME